MSYLTKWKEREAARDARGKEIRPAHSVDTLLHRKCGIVAVWRHQFPRVVTFEDRRTKEQVQKVWSSNLVCWEDESVLKKQYKRNDDGTRMLAPEKCGACRFVEHIRVLVDNGELAWTDPVLEFNGDDPKEDVTIHAGGLYNAFAQDLSQAELSDLKEHGISPLHAWKENAMAKMNYVFRVVDLSNVTAGTQIAIEPASLGDKVKGVIRDAIESDGDHGHPIKNPYVIRWKYDPAKNIEFNKKYAALAMRKLPIPDDALEIVTESDAPDISNLTDRFNARTVRSQLEQHCKIDGVPWDDLFGPAVREEEATDDRPRHAPEVGRKAAPPEPEMVGCDDCGEAMAITAAKCQKCGKAYDVEEEAKPAEPPPRQLPKRSEVGKAKPSISAKEDPVAPRAEKQKPAPLPPRGGKQVKPFQPAKEASTQPPLLEEQPLSLDDDDIPF